jgi:hypothetical protein
MKLKQHSHDIKKANTGTETDKVTHEKKRHSSFHDFYYNVYCKNVVNKLNYTGINMLP